jgi:hypothetical protein
MPQGFVPPPSTSHDLIGGPTHGEAGQDVETGVHLAGINSEALCSKL